MGKLKWIGIGSGGAIGGLFLLAFIIATVNSLNPEASNSSPLNSINISEQQKLVTSSRYEGLTEQEITNVKLIEDACKQNTEYAEITGGETASKIYAKRCEESVQDKIDNYRKNHVLKNALENRDVTLCDSLKLKEMCVEDFAKQTNDSSACNQLDDNTKCLINYAIASGNSDVCSQSKEIQTCVDELVPSFGASVCNNLEEEKLKDCQIKYLKDTVTRKFAEAYQQEGYNECMMKYLGYGISDLACHLEVNNLDGILPDDVYDWQQSGKISLCEHANQVLGNGGYHKTDDACLASIAVYTKDISKCDNANEDLRADCYASIALVEDSVTTNTCDQLNTDTQRAHCYSRVAARTLNENICNTPFPSDLNFQRTCITLVENMKQR